MVFDHGQDWQKLELKQPFEVYVQVGLLSCCHHEDSVIIRHFNMGGRVTPMNGLIEFIGVECFPLILHTGLIH